MQKDQKYYRDKYSNRKVYTLMGVIGGILFLGGLVGLFWGNIETEFGYIVYMVFCAFMLVVSIFGPSKEHYYEKKLVLLECKQFDANIYKCVFYNPETKTSENYIYQKQYEGQLEANKTYSVILGGSKNKINQLIEILEVVDNDTENHTSSARMEQALSQQELKEKEEQMEMIHEYANKAMDIGVIIQAVIAIIIGCIVTYIAIIMKVEPENLFVRLFVIMIGLGPAGIGIAQIVFQYKNRKK